MKATSVTHIENTIIDRITQPLLEKIKEAGSQIHDALIHGAIHSATANHTQLVRLVRRADLEIILNVFIAMQNILAVATIPWRPKRPSPCFISADLGHTTYGNKSADQQSVLCQSASKEGAEKARATK